jgi:hypothetical protein
MRSLNAKALVVAAALFAAASSRGMAQAGTNASKPLEQVPRFVRISADGSLGPSVVNPSDDPFLSRRVGINFRGVSRAAAIQEIALASGIRFVYAADLLPNTATVRLQSDNITAAAALTEVLRGTGVDVAVGANGNLILVRKPVSARSRAAADSTQPGARVTSGAIELAPIRTVAFAESRKTFELQPAMGHFELGVKELAAAPALVEGDVFRTIQLLPGVETRNDYSTGLNVRGGESDQNLILLDGYPVYNPFHLGGLLGTFIDPMVGKVDLLTGAAPVRYGERLSSVLDVQSAEEDRHGLHGAGDVSLLAVTASVGSAFDGGGSWMLGGRHTYADVIANAIKPNSLPYGFSDIQGHLSRPMFGGGVLSVTAYDGADGTSISRNTGGLNASWGNRVIGATLSKLIPNRRVVLGVLAADSISLVQRASLTTFDAAAVMSTRNFDLRSSVRDVRVSGSATLFTSAFDQSAGYEISAQHVHYSMRAPLTSITNFLLQATFDQSLTPVSGWYDALWHASQKLMVDGGVRVDAVNGMGWTGLSPRLSIKYFLSTDLALIAATGSYAQWLHSLAQENAPVQPLEFWIASSRTLPVSHAWQSSLGVEAWPTSTRQVRVEAFYKKYSNLIETNTAADASVGDNPIVELGGTSYGADVLVRQLDNGRFGGWIAYSYAVSERVTPTGERFAPGQDRRHELNAVGTCKYGRYRVSARLGMATGTPYTPIVGEFTRERYDPLGNTYAPDFGDGNIQYLSGATNSARLPFEHRLDVSITRVGSGDRVQISPYLSIANVYGAQNPAAYVFDYGQTKLVTTSNGTNVVTRTVMPDPVRTSIPNLPFLPTIGVHIVY